ncbi:MAG: DUF2953 domain-containing protein [Clostridia bacterium]|nr:DUF2953 domain-containing protein [Clostridia bacterium]
MPAPLIVALIAVGCVALFLVVLFTVHINVNVSMNENMALILRIFGIPIKLLPKKPKKYNPRHYTLKKIRKRDAAAAKAAEKKRQRKAKRKAEDAAEKAKKTAEERRAEREARRASIPAITDLVPLALNVTKLFCSRFFGKLHLRVAKLHVRIGASDAMTAAVVYGLANQAVQYTMEFLNKFCRVDNYSRSDIRIEPDFLIENVAFEFDLNVRVTLGGVVGALLKAGWKLLTGYLKIKPSPTNPKRTLLPPMPPLPPKPTPASPPGVPGVPTAPEVPKTSDPRM